MFHCGGEEGNLTLQIINLPSAQILSLLPHWHRIPWIEPTTDGSLSPFGIWVWCTDSLGKHCSAYIWIPPVLGNSLPSHFISRERSSPYLFSLQLQHTGLQLLFETTEEKPMGFVTGSSASSDKDLPNTVMPSPDVPGSSRLHNYLKYERGWGDGSVGKNAWCTCCRMWVQIHSVHGTKLNVAKCTYNPSTGMGVEAGRLTDGLASYQLSWRKNDELGFRERPCLKRTEWKLIGDILFWPPHLHAWACTLAYRHIPTNHTHTHIHTHTTHTLFLIMSFL